jgi:multiple sugar transport system permease protein
MSRDRRASRPRTAGRVATYLLLAVLAVPFVFPVYWMVVTGLKPISEVFATPPDLLPDLGGWQNFVEPFRRGPFARQFLNSAYIATLSTVGVLAVASLAGYAFARIRFRGSTVLFILLLSTLLVPAEVTIIPLFRLMNALGWIDTHLPLIVLPVFSGVSILGTFLMRQFFLSLPAELEQAGRIDGLGRFGLFRYVALPLARAPLAALAVLAFLSSWNEFLEPLVFLRTRELWTLPLALSTFTDPYTGVPIWNIQMAATSLSVLPVLVVFFLAQRQFVEGIAGTGIK